MDFKVLVHSHDAQLFLLLRHILAIEGIAASHTEGREEAAAACRDDAVRAVVVDCSSPGTDMAGFRTLKAQRPELAIVLLLKRTSGALALWPEEDGLDLVMSEPFNPALLIKFLHRLRFERMIARSTASTSDHLLSFADLEMNTAAVKVCRNGHNIPLSPLQFRLLRHLLQNPSAVQSRDQLIAAGWVKDAEVEPRTVDIHIGHIRRALRRFGPDLIRTVRTLGYTLDADTDPDNLPECHSND